MVPDLEPDPGSKDNLSVGSDLAHALAWRGIVGLQLLQPNPGLTAAASQSSAAAALVLGAVAGAAAGPGGVVAGAVSASGASSSGPGAGRNCSTQTEVSVRLIRQLAVQQRRLAAVAQISWAGLGTCLPDVDICSRALAARRAVMRHSLTCE